MNIPIPPSISALFSRRINVLIVEDDENLLTTLADLFSTPFTTVTSAADMSEARSAIAKLGGSWHCWIVDLSLGGKQDAGMALIKENGNFPFAVVYSGIGSMESASHAIRLGAEAVIDKGSGSIAKLVREVCAIAPLALLCRGSLSKSKEILFLLKNHAVREPKEWADLASLTLRQLQNISTMQTGLPPSFVIPFYHCLRCLLEAGISGNPPPAEDREFCHKCLKFIEENLPTYKKLF